MSLFPQGQFVAVQQGSIVGTCSNTVISDERWLARQNWYQTVGGPDLTAFSLSGTTLYGLDITVHRGFRRRGIGRSFYEARYRLAQSMLLQRYGTACRMPDFRSYELKQPGMSVERYAELVVAGEFTDRTLTPLLRYGLRFLGVIREFMPDYESANAAALLEWLP